MKAHSIVLFCAVVVGAAHLSGCAMNSKAKLLTIVREPPPGNTVMWRGLSRLTDIALGAMVGAENCG